MLTQIYIVALAVIALIVYQGLLKKKNMWLWIVLYWLVLFTKNVLDVCK